MQTDRRGDLWCALWSLALALALLGPALGSGFVLSYDMVWVPDLGLRPDFLGLGSGLPRAVPSDAVVAVLDEVVPGIVLQKVVLLGALVAGGTGAARLVPGPLAIRLLATGLYQWNAYAVERLLIGHWPVLLCTATLPWVLLLARRWREEGALPAGLLLLLPVGSLSASAGVMTAVALVVAAAGRGRNRVVTLVVAAANAPWVVTGLAHASNARTDPDGAHVFALHDEGSVPGPLAALTLGGTWNSEVVPDSRTGALGWVTLLVLVGLAALGVRRWWRTAAARERLALLVCWATGWVGATLTWLAPDAVGWLGEQVPGLGLVRDGGRLLALCAPLLVVLVANGAATVVERAGRSRVTVPATVLAGALLPVALLPDAVWGANDRLGAVAYPASYDEVREEVRGAVDRGLRGDLLVLPLSSFRQPEWNDGRTVFDPVGRYLTPDYVASDVLVVSGTTLSGEDPRVLGAQHALEAPTPQERARRLSELGIGGYVLDRSAPGADAVPEVAGRTLADTTELTVVDLSGTAADRRSGPLERAAVTTAWLAFAALVVGAFVVASLRRRRC